MAVRVVKEVAEGGVVFVFPPGDTGHPRDILRLPGSDYHVDNGAAVWVVLERSNFYFDVHGRTRTPHGEVGNVGQRTLHEGEKLRRYGILFEGSTV